MISIYLVPQEVGELCMQLTFWELEWSHVKEVEQACALWLAEG